MNNVDSRIFTFRTSIQRMSILCGIPTVLACLVAACADDGSSSVRDAVDTDEPELVGAAAPANTDRTLGCDIASLPASAKRAMFRGRDVEYFRSDEIGYETDAWYGPEARWISKDALDSSVLGSPGYPTLSRNESPGASNLRISIVDVRKIEGKLAYHYFSNETGASRIENWSSTKALVMLQAGQTLRTESGGTHGLPSTIFGGRDGAAASGAPTLGAWVGTHISEVARSSDNGTAVWLKSITGASGSTTFVRNWLDTRAEFGGGHGSAPRELGNRFKEQNQGTEFTSGRASSFSSNSSNTMTPIAMAEFWKRLAVNKADPVTWLKKADYAKNFIGSAQERKDTFFNPASPFALKDDDLKVLNYGYINSVVPGGLLLGAVQHPNFVDAFGGKAKLDRLTGGKWRMFGKTGSTDSVARNSGDRREAAFGGYLCIPADPNRATLKSGRLVVFFVNAQATESAAAPRLRALQGVANTMIPELNGAPNLWGSR